MKYWKEKFKCLLINLKSYILVKEYLPKGWAALSAAHAAVKMYIEYQDDEVTKDWASGSFRKVVCGVTDEQFEAAKKEQDRVIFVEDDLGEGTEVSIGFKPRKNWPSRFRQYRLLT